MKTPERSSYCEPHSGDVWLEKIKLECPDMVFIDGVADIAAIASRQLDVRYGAQSETPLSYHNRSHSMNDVSSRSRKLLRIHNRVRPDLFDMNRAPSLVTAGAFLHDVIQLRGSMKNELLSAEYARDKAPHYGFTYAESDVLYDMIMSTATQYVDGTVKQTMLEQMESRDPLCLILATADINGIAMEGLKCMVVDSVNLTAENQQMDAARVLREKPHEVAKMLGAQALFFGTRLDMIGSDLRLFYDEESAQEIEAIYKHEFSSFGSEAIRAARLLGRTPDLLNDLLPVDVAATVESTTNTIVSRVRNVLA